MDLTVTELRSFQRCELDWFYAFVRRRVPRRRSTALTLGTWWHDLMASYFTAPDSSGFDRFSAKSWALVSAARKKVELTRELEIYGTDPSEFVREAHKLTELFDHHWTLRFSPQEVLHVEEAIRVPLDGTDHFLQGIPDTIIRFSDRYWHLQHKTAGPSVPMTVFTRIAERSLHELVYAHLITNHLSIPAAAYGGSYFNIVRKLSAKALESQPSMAFVQELIPIDQLQITDALSDIRRLAARMQAIRDGSVLPIDNRDCDGGMFGNSLSPYFDVKTGRALLGDDSLFEDATSRYDEVPL